MSFTQNDPLLPPREVDSQLLGQRPPRTSVDETSPHRKGGEKNEPPYSNVSAPVIIESPYGSRHDGDDDHLVSLVFPPRNKDTPKKSRRDSTKKKEPQKKLSKPISLDDVFLSLESSSSTSLSSQEAPSKGDAWGDSPPPLPPFRGGHQHTQSATHVELDISANENGLLFPPQLASSSSEHPLMEAHHYDRLPKRSEYDHLPPLGPSPEYGMGYYRPRSTSDVSSRRVRPRNSKDEFIASEVRHS